MENTNTTKKDTTKEKIILFVIGVLIGAVISTVAFFVCIKILGVNNTNGSTSQQIQGGTSPEASTNGDQSNQGGTPPEKPTDENGQNNQGETPPEKPDGDNSSNSNS